MTKGELRSIIRDVLHEELAKPVLLNEAFEGPTYIIRAWDHPEQRKGLATYDSSKKGKQLVDFDDVLALLKTTELAGKGAYEITWVQSTK